MSKNLKEKERWDKFNTQEIIRENHFKTTSFYQLLKNFNLLYEQSPWESEPNEYTIEQRQFCKRINKTLKKEFTLYEVQNIYNYLFKICDKNFQNIDTYLHKEFEELEQQIEEKDEEIKYLKSRLDKAENLLLDDDE